MKLRKWLLCGYGIRDKITDPREINQFIQDVMNPYKDKIDEIKTKPTNTDDIEELVKGLSNTNKLLNEKRKDEHKRRKKTITNLKKANVLLKENMNLTEQICNKMEVYDKLEKGEYDKINYDENNILKLKKSTGNGVIRLLGINTEEHENIKLQINLHDEERGSISGSDDEQIFVDYDVCKAENDEDEEKEN
jgi:hypothetical protein